METSFPGVVKINTDGACATSSSGIEVIHRDDRSENVAAMVDVLPRISPQLAEIAAIREGLRVAVRLGLSRVMLETDSLSSIL